MASYTMQHYEVRESAEMVTLLPCPKVNTLPDDKRVLFEIDLGAGVRPGEILQCSYQFECTNDLHKYTGDNAWSNVMVVDGLILSETSSQPNGLGDRVGREVNEQYGTNVTPGQHHGRMSGMVQWLVPPLYETLTDFRYLKLIAWSASSKSVTAFPGLKIELDYGHLDCIRWTPIPV